MSSLLQVVEGQLIQMLTHCRSSQRKNPSRVRSETKHALQQLLQMPACTQSAAHVRKSFHTKMCAARAAALAIQLASCCTFRNFARFLLYFCILRMCMQSSGIQIPCGY